MIFGRVISKQSYVCPECNSWMEEKLIKGVLWVKCRSCKYAAKASKRIVRPLK